MYTQPYTTGWFEFRLCPNNNVKRVITSECLNQNLLSIVSVSNLTRTRLLYHLVIDIEYLLCNNSDIE